MVKVMPSDIAAAAGYWGNDNPPIELREAFARHRIAGEVWRAAVDDALVQNFRTADEFDTPRDAVRWLIEWEQKLALDPAVSAEARALFVRGSKAGLEKAAEKCADYMFDCIEDHDVFKNWPRTKRQNDIYAKLIRNIDPEEGE